MYKSKFLGMKKMAQWSILFFVLVAVIFSCKKDDEDAPTTGVLKGKVTSISNSLAISGVRIIVYDANTNSPSGSIAGTDSEGNYNIELEPGTYYLNLSKQGFNSIPASGITPVFLTVELSKETINNFQLEASSITNGGNISGKVTSGGNPLPGVLVVASNDTAGYSSVTAPDGSYFIFNVPAGDYEVQGFLSNYGSPTLSVTLAASASLSGKDLAMTSGASGSVEGTVSFLATNNGEVDVTLTNPLTKETIPGLVTKTVAGEYSIPKVPNGTYIVRASYANDGYVVDPDWILKNGEPTVTVAGSVIAQNFSVTGAVKLVSPTNDSTSTIPIEVTGTTPTFTWLAYSSASDYVIEVSDVNGNVVWGGFTKGTTITKNILIPKNQLSIVYNSDGKAKTTLKSKSIYRWRVFVSKDDNAGWKLISVSEEQRGLFIVK